MVEAVSGSREQTGGRWVRTLIIAKMMCLHVPFLDESGQLQVGIRPMIWWARSTQERTCQRH